jgi:hypothetical protein
MIRKINGIKAVREQSLTIAIDNIQVKIVLYYNASVERWFLDIESNGKKVNGVMLQVSDSLLTAYERFLNVNIACICNRPVTKINDFQQEVASLYVYARGGT